MNSFAKDYGIWCKTGWLRAADGQIFHSWSPNAMQAVIHDDRRADAEVREIGPDGLPIEPDIKQQISDMQLGQIVRTILPNQGLYHVNEGFWEFEEYIEGESKFMVLGEGETPEAALQAGGVTP